MSLTGAADQERWERQGCQERQQTQQTQMVLSAAVANSGLALAAWMGDQPWIGAGILVPPELNRVAMMANEEADELTSDKGG